MRRIVVIGTTWGDEGKGKITDFLAERAEITARFQGGNNAGHSVQVGARRVYFQSLPSGVLHQGTVNLITNGAVVNPRWILTEIAETGINDLQLFISDRAHVIFPHHLAIEKAQEARKGKARLETTGKGIGPTYTDKAARIGMRMGMFVSPYFREEFMKLMAIENDYLAHLGAEPLDAAALYAEYQSYADRLRPLVIDTSVYLNQAIADNKKILFEGAQGVLLDLEQGTYPYVTSSSPTAAAVPVATGIAPWLLEGAVGVVKAYVSREGAGPMPTLMPAGFQEKIHATGVEYEPRTKQNRRTGWLDTVLLRHAKRVSGLSYLAVTALDVLDGFPEIKICVGYKLDGQTLDRVPSITRDFARCEPEYITMPGWLTDTQGVKSFSELPVNAQKYLNKISELVGVPIAIFSVGPGRNQTIPVIELFDAN